jgi:hypothetical protein
MIKLPEPVATVESWTNGSYWRNYKLNWQGQADAGDNLYTESQLKQAMRDVLEESAKIAVGSTANVYRECDKDEIYASAIEIRKLKEQLK